jgi:hypothetical protein
MRVELVFQRNTACLLGFSVTEALPLFKIGLHSRIVETCVSLGRIPSVRKIPHIAHKGGSQEVSHIQNLISRQAGQEENGAAAFLSRSDLK